MKEIQKTKWRVWLLLFPIIFGLSCNHAEKKNAKSETNERYLDEQRERHCKAMRLDSLLCNRAFGEALLFLDSLHQQYPQDPQFYFGEGWVYDMQDDSTNAHAAFRKARALYDSLILKNDDLGDKINRAFITQILEGKEAYDLELNQLAKSVKDDKDSLYVESFHNYIYEKEFLFREKVNGIR
ncbi:MAG: hypothetical protein IKQ62_04880 [Bacteroidaceae bacterium]|nr:hypothetical protein [Bacteroidaceae bacterium]